MRCVDLGLREPVLSRGLSRKQLKEGVKSLRTLLSMLKGSAIPITEGQMNGVIPKFGQSTGCRVHQVSILGVDILDVTRFGVTSLEHFRHQFEIWRW